MPYLDKFQYEFHIRLWGEYIEELIDNMLIEKKTEAWSKLFGTPEKSWSMLNANGVYTSLSFPLQRLKGELKRKSETSPHGEGESLSFLELFIFAKVNSF